MSPVTLTLAMNALLAQAESAATARDTIGLSHYLIVSALVFTLGVVIIVARRNAIAVLMGIELLLNSAGLNFVAFSKFLAPRHFIEGQVLTVFIIVLAAAEAALALAIILNIYNNVNTVEVDEADTLKG